MRRTTPSSIKRPLLLPLFCCTLIALTACGSGSDDDATGQGGKGKSAPSPAASLTLVDGKLTESMCGVLSAQDFADVGLQVQPTGGARSTLLAPNEVGCLTQSVTEKFELNLQPDPVSAGLYLDQDRAFHDSFMQPEGPKERALAEDVVLEADESWVGNDDLGYPGEGTVLAARQGSLVLTMRQKAQGDAAQKGLIELASRVLQRIPEVGQTTTGKPHVVKFTVKGSGQADIDYSTPGSTDSQRVDRADLPWSKVFKFPHFGTAGAPFRLSIFPSLDESGATTCEVEIDGKKVASGDAQSLESCVGEFKEES